jgi:dolichol-phosphate mannosyltransferase
LTSKETKIAPPDAVQAKWRPTLSVVVPTYRESANVPVLFERVKAALEGVPWEMIVVDDDSPDGTAEIAFSLAAADSRMRCLRRVNRSGLAGAVVEGWMASSADLVAVIDGDLQHDETILPEMYRALAGGLGNLAIGTRAVDERRGGLSPGRQKLSDLGAWFFRRVTGTPVTDPMSGFFMIRRTSIQERELSPLGYKILIEVLARGSVKWIAEVPYTFRERAEGASKLTSKIYIEYFQHLLRLRLYLFQASSFVRFCVVGASGVVIDMSMLYLLSDPSTLHWGLTRSKFLAAEAALLNNFIWNDMWTFGDISREQNTMSQRAKRFLKFNAICSIGIILNILILNIEFNFFHMNRYVANLVAIGLVTLWNYKSNKEFSWRVTARA